MIWSMLIHLGFNFWEDRPESKFVKEFGYRLRSDALRCEDATWEATVNALHRAGANQVIIDLGDGIQFDSHPEIAVKGAWSKDRLYQELNRLRELSIEPIPKLNFSAGHDEWMGQYARMISTPAYYDFCRDLIAESMELFGTPAYFHIGMDEENEYIQHEMSHSIIRRHDLWYHDLQFYADEIVSRGGRPWMWSDKAWEDETNFLNKVSRDILQSNWYYGLDFNGKREPKPGEANFQKPEDIEWFARLEAAGFDQVPAGSNFANSENLGLLVDHCRQVISPGHLVGFLQTTWYPTLDCEQTQLTAAADQLATAREKFN